MDVEITVEQQRCLILFALRLSEYSALASEHIGLDDLWTDYHQAIFNIATITTAIVDNRIDESGIVHAKSLEDMINIIFDETGE